jgi:4-amino-4-deoxy-L-arabinose transferase-like glycosyltransferase
MRRSRLGPALLGGAWLLTALLWLCYIRTPFFSIDEAMYAVMATRLPQGEWPLLDYWDNKPPMTTFIYAAAFFLLGQSMVGPHLFALAARLLTLWLIYALGRRVLPDWAAGLAALFDAVLATTLLFPWEFFAANTEVFMVVPYVLAVLWGVSAVLSGRSRGWWGAGAALGLGLWIKQPILAALPVLFLLAWWRPLAVGAGGESRARLGRLGALGAGLLLGAAPVPLLYAALGGLGDLFFWTFRWGVQYSGLITPAERWARVLYTGRLILGSNGANLAWALVGLCCAVLAAARSPAPGARGAPLRGAESRTGSGPLPRVIPAALVLWLLLSIAAVYLPGRCYAHYYYQLTPPVALLAAWGVRAAVQRIRGRTPVLVALAALVAAGLAYPVWREHRQGIARLLRTGEPLIVNMKWTYGPQEETAARYLRERIRPGEPVFVWGFCPQLLFLSGAAPACTAFSCEYYNPPKLIPGSRRELLEDLRRTRPHYVVDTAAAGYYEHPPLRFVPGLEEWVRENYSLEAVVAGFRIYARREEPPP